MFVGREAGKFELAGEAVKKHRRGVPLTDDEIEAAIVVLTYLNKAVPPLGKEYTLFAKDIGQQLGMMEGYRDARAEEKRLAAKKGG
jgi:hypothetical protein